jgi:23S rRNA pseudouridine1911/1915/1917 synthase
VKPLVFEIQSPAALLEFLFAALPDKSRTTVRSYLTRRQVSINRIVTTQFDARLRPGDRVEVSAGKGRAEFRHPMLRIVWEDDALVVIDKKYGLLSMATDKIVAKTAYHILSEHVKEEDPRNRIFILHRLDRETSGLMIFAKSQQIQQRMQADWHAAVPERKYYAVAEGRFDEPQGRIVSYLAENKVFKVYATTPEQGREAVLTYRVLQQKEDYSLLEIELETGRKNQIRAQLEAVGHPIAGDRKYGATTNPLGRVALHAGTITFVHPVSGETLSFDTPLPYKFNALFGRR